MKQKHKVMVIDADVALGQTIRRFLGEGFSCVVGICPADAADLDQASAQTHSQTSVADCSAVLIAVSAKAGLNAIRILSEEYPDVPIIALMASARVQGAVTALRAGAVDVLENPYDLPRLKESVAAAIGQADATGASQAIREEAAEDAGEEVAQEKLVEMATLASPILPGEADELSEAADSAQPSPEGLEFKKGRSMIGNSESLRHVFNLIAKLSQVETSVLIRGESGTGKELVAQALHYNSPRSKGPFVSVNCGAIPDTLIESELFGHEKGAFTGADRKKVGKFEFAQGGTIFLDEIGDISAHMQVKLLRVLQEKKFIPLGSNKEVEADVRVISATNKPLEQMMTKEEFRSDLFYRLNVLPIHLPPLRERRDDIVQLAEFLISKFNRIHCRDIRSIAADALGALQRYGWPGNIRELENAIEHAFIMETSQQIKISSLPSVVADAPLVSEPTPCSALHGSSAAASSPPSGQEAKPSRVSRLSERQSAQQASADPAPTAKGARDVQGAANGEATMSSVFQGVGDELKYPELKEQFEKWFLERALKAHNGRINQTAEGTQMTKVTLLRKLQKYGIDPKEYRD